MQQKKPDEIEYMMNTYVPIVPSEKKFLALGLHFYREYLSRLSSEDEEDFDGLMRLGAEKCNLGCVTFSSKSGRGNLDHLKYIFIDEFQDFSESFFQIIQAIRNQNKKAELFCVGDEWQAINGFAGSELRFINGFSTYFGPSHHELISTNYRSSKAIVDIGNALMFGKGVPSKHGKKIEPKEKRYIDQVKFLNLGDFKPSIVERQNHPYDRITPVVLRIIHSALKDNLDVVMLSRRNSIDWYVHYTKDRNGKDLDSFLDHIRSYFSNEDGKRIDISTTHTYKGMQKAVVILLDAVAKSYPLIHPGWVFSRIFGNSIEKIIEEERRLLYVALTRAVYKLVVIADGEDRSPFLDDISKHFRLHPFVWSEFPPLVNKTNKRLIVRIHNQENRTSGGNHQIKEYLKLEKYSFDPQHKFWEKDFLAEEFHIEKIRTSTWGKVADSIEIEILNEAFLALEKYIVNKGLWRCVFNSQASPHEDYSLEYLLGFRVIHDKYGMGTISTINDNRRTCRIRFSNEGELEISVDVLLANQPPWHVGP